MHVIIGETLLAWLGRNNGIIAKSDCWNHWERIAEHPICNKKVETHNQYQEEMFLIYLEEI